jgi:hypothetical protein
MSQLVAVEHLGWAGAPTATLTYGSFAFELLAVQYHHAILRTAVPRIFMFALPDVHTYNPFCGT